MMNEFNVDDIINDLAGKVGQLSAENAVLKAQLKFCQNKIADNKDSAE